MAVSMRAVPALAVVLLASVFVVADDAQSKADEKQSASAQPAAAREQTKAGGAAKARAVRLTKPWKDLASLTDEQKRQINQIHRQAVQEVKAVEQREKADIMALLNDQQKAELTALLEKAAAERKAKAAQRSTKPAASTSQKNPAGAGAAVAVTEKAVADKKSAVGSD